MPPPRPPVWLPPSTDESLAGFRELAWVKELGLSWADARELATKLKFLPARYLLVYYQGGTPRRTRRRRETAASAPRREK